MFTDLDDDWENFMNNKDDENSNNSIRNNNNINHLDAPKQIPKASDIYISTKTKIVYLNIDNVDIKNIFWKIPIVEYYKPENGVIKKQIKFSCSNEDELNEIQENLKNIKYYDEQVIEHLSNPQGRIKFKDQRKISIGLSKKDILTCRSKKKRAFFNCFVLILRIFFKDEYKEMHAKIFNTGKIEIPGLQNDEMLKITIDIIVNTLKPFTKNNLSILNEKIETVLINSNFTCGYFINRDKLHDILKYKYRINSNYDACSYPGIQCKFYYDNSDEKQTGQQGDKKDEVSFMIFRTGSVLIVGKCEEKILYEIYDFIKKILYDEYGEIHENIPFIDKDKTKQKKVRKKILIIKNDK